MARRYDARIPSLPEMAACLGRPCSSSRPLAPSHSSRSPPPPPPAGSLCSLQRLELAMTPGPVLGLLRWGWRPGAQEEITASYSRTPPFFFFLSSMCAAHSPALPACASGVWGTSCTWQIQGGPGEGCARTRPEDTGRPSEQPFISRQNEAGLLLDGSSAQHASRNTHGMQLAPDIYALHAAHCSSLSKGCLAPAELELT